MLQILLKLQALIGRDERIKARGGCSRQQLAIREARPALLLDGRDIVTDYVRCELARELFIEQNVHGPSAFHVRPRARR